MVMMIVGQPCRLIAVDAVCFVAVSRLQIRVMQKEQVSCTRRNAASARIDVVCRDYIVVTRGGDKTAHERSVPCLRTGHVQLARHETA